MCLPYPCKYAKITIPIIHLKEKKKRIVSEPKSVISYFSELP